MNLGLLDQLQIFWQLYLIELLGLLKDLGLLEPYHCRYLKFLAEFGMLVFLTNLGLTEFQVRHLVLSPLFKWFWMASFHKNIQVMLEFFKGPFLMLHFSQYTLMIFLMMLSVILLSRLVILLSTLNVIRHLICGNNWNSLLNLNVTNEILWTGTGSALFISVLEKLN